MAFTMLCACYVAAQLWFAPAVFGNPTCNIDEVGDACPRSEDGLIDESALIQVGLHGNVLTSADTNRKIDATHGAITTNGESLSLDNNALIGTFPSEQEKLPDINPLGLNQNVPTSADSNRKIDPTYGTITTNGKAPESGIITTKGNVDKSGIIGLSQWMQESGTIGTIGKKLFPWADGETRWNYLLTGAISWAIWMVLALVVVQCCYTREFETDIAATSGLGQDPQKSFNSGHFDCFSDMWTCFASCVCIGIRWADTVSQLGFLTFWSAFGLFAFLSLLNEAIGGFGGFGVITACALLYYRALLREKLQLPAWTFSTCLLDCCFVFCCTCCAVAQEARVLKEVKQQDAAGGCAS